MYQTLSVDYATNKEYRIIISEKENAAYEAASPGQVINLELINSQSDKNLRKEKPFDADLLYWTDDITLRAFPPSRANSIVVSTRLFEKLSGLNLPAFNWFAAKIDYNPQQLTDDSYKIIQFTQTIADLTDYGRSTYQYKKRRSTEVLKVTEGEYDSYEAYSKAEMYYFDEEGVKLEISKRVLIADYDIAGGIHNQLRVHKRVKLGSALKGVQLMPITDFSLISPADN